MLNLRHLIANALLKPQSIGSMPKVTVTAKRARKAFATEPLVPDSIKQEISDQAQKLGPTTRSGRFTRYAAAQAADPSSIDIKPDPGTRATDKDLKEIKHAERTRPKEIKAEEPPSRPKRGRKASTSKAAGGTVKQEVDTDMQTGAVNANNGAASVDEEHKPVAKKARKSVKQGRASKPAQGNEALPDLDEASGIDDQDNAEEVAAEQGTEEAPKKKRKARGPSGFAVRGENADDSSAARRQRLKAERDRLKKAEKEGLADVLRPPEVLDNEVAKMCRELGDDSLAMTAPWELQDGTVGGLKWWTGCHVSIAGGHERAVINAAATGCRAFALDTRNKVQWESKPLTEENAAAFKEACQKFGYRPEQILPHGSYLINLASPNPEMAEKGFNGLVTELKRCEQLGLTMYNFHPGSTTGLCTHEESMDRIAGYINKAHDITKGVTVVLENMSSVGNIVGGKIWHLRYIIDRVHDKSRIGFCIDTCHLFSSGVDLRTEEDCENAFKEIDSVVGFRYLKGLHVNDSKTQFDSHRDRHENIGRGSIPMVAFRWIMNNPAFQGIPMIMETPVQEREAPVDYAKSLKHGKIWWKDPEGPYGVGTDRRDVILLNSLIHRNPISCD